MRIRTKLAWLGVLPLLILLLLAGHTLVLHDDLERVYEKSRKTDDLFKHAADLTVVSYEILSGGGERPLAMWMERWQLVADDQATLRSWARHPDELYLLDDVQALLSHAKRLREEYAQTSPDRKIYRETVGQRLLVEVRSLYPLGEKLNELHHTAMEELIHRQGWINFLLLSALAVIVSLVAFALIRTIAGSLFALRTGIQNMADGHRDRPVLLQGRDELTEVASQFNQMTERLHQTTVSRDELQREVQERMLIEEKLRASELCFRTVADFTYDWEYWTDPDGEMRYVSPACERITGYNRVAFLTDANLLMRIVHPADRALLAHHQASARDQSLPPIDFRVVHRDGRMRWIGHACQPVHDQDGQFLGRRSNNRDITDRKEVEEEYHTIVQTALDGFWFLDMEGRLLEVNDAYCQMSGYSQEELLSMTVDMLEADETPEEVRHHIAQVCRDGHGRFESRHRHKNGSLIDLEISVHHLPLHGGVLIAFLRDISTRRRAQQAMALAKTAAEEANRAKSEFLANMSHEIRTPMNAILGMADLLWESPLSFEQRKYVQVFRSAGETLMGIINDVLDFSKIEAGRMELEEIDINLEEEIETVCTIMAPHAHAKGLELAWRIVPGVPIFLRGDPARLRQILLNLLSNAVKFTKEGEIALNVEQAPSTPREGEILLSVTVRDTGIGIAPHQLASIFDSFVQADLSMTRRFGGTGLGLAIVKRLVEHMGGEITVESRPGRGSTFCFTVCLLTGTERYDRLPTLDLTGIRALVVDDTESNRLVLREILEQTGAAVVEAGDGQTALLTLERAKAENMPFQLLLLDVRMPGMDGFRVVECCRAACHPGVPILMLTSDHREHHRERCAALGVRRYLVKPARHADLLSAIADALGVPETVSPRLTLEPSECVPEQPLRILLVDDSDDNRLLVQVFLDTTSYELDSAENGVMALDKLKTGHYDLVLMDVQMPVMDGYSATRAWRAWEQEQKRQPIPIIALTAYALQEDIDRSLASGCNDHLTKPIRKKTLLETISRHGRMVQSRSI
ncbi:MAG: response regulator [Magnetococcus sp. MYC-9]